VILYFDFFPPSFFTFFSYEFHEWICCLWVEECCWMIGLAMSNGQQEIQVIKFCASSKSIEAHALLKSLNGLE